MANRKAVGPEGLQTGVLKVLADEVDPATLRQF